MNARHSSLSGFHLVVLILAGFIAFAVLLTAPAQSRAAEEPFKINFDQSTMQFGLLSDLPLGELASTGSLEGTIDENGNVTVPKGKFILPEIGITEPIALKAFMGVESDATGTFNRETGELVLNAKAGVWFSVDLQALLGLLGTAGVELPVDSGILETVLGNVNELTCGFSPMDVTFTTGETSLGTGQPFAAGPLGPGALTAEWAQLGPFAGKTKILGLIDACQAIKMYAPDLIEGALGGVLPEGSDLEGIDIAALLENLDNVNLGPSSLTLTRTLDENEPPEVDPPAEGKPQLKINARALKRKVRRGERIGFKVKVRNVGEKRANGVRVCLTGPGVGLLVRWRCRKFGGINSGKAKSGTFRVRVDRKALLRKAKFRFRVKSSNSATRTADTRLLIRR